MLQSNVPSKNSLFPDMLGYNAFIPNLLLCPNCLVLTNYLYLGDDVENNYFMKKMLNVIYVEFGLVCNSDTILVIFAVQVFVKGGTT